MAEIKKAVILCAGIGTRFLPLSKTISRQLLPLADKPIIHYLVEELGEAGIKQIVFVLPPGSSQILSYFKQEPTLEKILEKRNGQKALLELKRLQEFQKRFSFSYVIQKKPLGDGDALLQASPKLGKEPFALLFCDDVVESRIPCVTQLLKVFKTSKRPVVALYRVSDERISAHGVVGVERIAKRFSKIRKIVEKPSFEQAPSDLAILGRYILTPEIFDYLEAMSKETRKKNRIGKGIMLSSALSQMLDDGKIIYGYEVEGKWLSCGDKIDWLKSHLYLSLKHPQFGNGLKRYLKEII